MARADLNVRLKMMCVGAGLTAWRHPKPPELLAFWMIYEDLPTGEAADEATVSADFAARLAITPTPPTAHAARVLSRASCHRSTSTVAEIQP